jgi:hypothetical protein
MKLRIAIWAGIGAFVALLWTLYMSEVTATPNGITRALIHLTCPVSLFGHYPISFYLVLLVNAATYALAGTVVEIMRVQGRRRPPRHSDPA